MSCRVVRTASLALAVTAALPLLRAQEPPPGAGGKPPAQNQPQGSPPDTQQPVTAPQQKGVVLQIGDTTVKFGGYVQVDVIHDFNQIGSPDSFDPRTIPTAGGSDSAMNTRIHARQTRLNVDVRGPTSIGPGRVFLEGDFFGDNNAFRMRHAYATVEGLLIGQTWSTFMDEDAQPETLDYESPIGFPSIRQAMVRYTHQCGEGSYLAVALEDPRSDIVSPPVTGDVEEPVPDLTGRFYWKHGLGHTQLGVFAGAARFNPDAGPAENELLWGLNLSSRIDVCKKDYAICQVTYGDGVGRYRGGITAAPDSSGHLEAIEVFAVVGGYHHSWCDQWRSNVTYSWVKGNLPAGVPATTSEKLSYLAANVIWQFADKAWCGIEYLYGSNDTFDDHRGEATRVQFSVHYDF